MKAINNSSPAGTLPGSILRPDEAARQSRSGSVSDGSVTLKWVDPDQPGGSVGDKVVHFHDLPGAVRAGVINQPPQAPLVVQEQEHDDAEAFDIEAQPPEGPVREAQPCCSENAKCIAAVTTAICAVVGTTIVGGVLAFTSDDPKVSADGAIAFCAGLAVIANVACCMCCD